MGGKNERQEWTEKVNCKNESHTVCKRKSNDSWIGFWRLINGEGAPIALEIRIQNDELQLVEWMHSKLQYVRQIGLDSEMPLCFKLVDWRRLLEVLRLFDDSKVLIQESYHTPANCVIYWLLISDRRLMAGMHTQSSQMFDFKAH